MPTSPRFVPSLKLAPDPRVASVWFAFAGDDLLVAEQPASAAAPLAAPVTADLAALLGAPLVRVQPLGTLDGRPCFAVELPREFTPPPGHRALSLRRLYDQLDPLEYELAGTAYQVQHWDRGHLFCSACASPLAPREGERSKVCGACGATYFPRVAPAAIVLVHDGPRVLLTRQARFPKGMYGLVAGFLEPGESLEACAAREIREETGVEVEDLVYFGSQPWPFPHQVMVGFTARYAGGELVVDTGELEDARWFDASAMPQLPPRLSIARRLLDAWLERVRG